MGSAGAEEQTVRSLAQETTPVENAPNLSDWLGIELRIKRDDYYPMSGGGNKARKIRYILRAAIEKGHDAIVTNGGVQSNHARAAALACAAGRLQCRLVLHGDPSRPYPLTGNLLLMKLAGAQIEIVPIERLGEAMDEAVSECRRAGLNPLYVWGGGHCLEGSLAYRDAAGEFQSQQADWKPDFVVLASGTGTTQAGLHVGFASSPACVVGVSVARDRERGMAVVQESVKELACHLGSTAHKDIVFRDDWICGGYEQFDEEILDILDMAARLDGLILDPTYTGKAFRGLVDMVGSGFIPRRSKVLFWHTGGLLNLTASEHFLSRHL